MSLWIKARHLKVHPNKHSYNLLVIGVENGSGLPALAGLSVFIKQGGAHSVRDVADIRVQRLDTGLPLPQQAHEGDAGFDLYSSIDGVLSPGGGRLLVPTGFAVAIPLGYAGFVLPRSGLALNYGISVVNAPGLIDSHYRGELKVVLLNTDPSRPYHVHRGDRIAQLVIQQVEHVNWVEVSELDANDRGGGFGHSGR